MFPKALLLLPICFQGIRTLSNSGEVVKEIHGGLKIGKAVSVRIKENDSELRFPPSLSLFQCKLFLASESEIDKGDADVGLHVSAEALGVHINTKSNGTWNNGDDYTTDYPKIDGFEVVVEEGFFDIRIFDKQIYRDFDVPIERLKYFKVECSSEVTFDFKWERKFVLCPSKP